MRELSSLQGRERALTFPVAEPTPVVRVLLIMECTIGGTRRHLRDLAHGLVARGHRVDVIAATLREPRMARDLEAMRAKGIGVRRLEMVRPISPLTDAWHGLQLAAALPGRRYDVVHTHSSKAGALGRVTAALFSGAARVHTPHTYASSFAGGKGQGGAPPGPPGLLLATERVLGRFTDRLIHVSEAERAEGQALGVIPSARACVVANGIDPSPFAEPRGGAELRAEFGIPADAPVIGSVGLLNDAKGHDVLLDALPALTDDAQLLFVGHGELEDELREQARRLDVASRVHFLGWRDDILACLDAMDLFCLSSRWEGMSYALLEAAAAGLASVSTDVNGSREVLVPEGEPPGGTIVPCADPAALAVALNELLTDTERRAAYAETARARVAERFSLDAMLSGTLAVYSEARAR